MTTRGHHGLLLTSAGPRLVSRLDFTVLPDSSPVVDDTGKSWSMVANGGSVSVLSGALRANGGGYITTPDSTDWDFGSEEHCIEAICEVMATPGEYPLLGKWAPATGLNWFCGFGNTGQQAYYLSTTGGTYFGSGFSPIALSTPLHLAWYRRTGSSPGYYMSYAGSVTYVTAGGDFGNVTTNVTAAALNYALGGLNIRLLQLRVQRGQGSALPATNYTPPTSL